MTKIEPNDIHKLRDLVSARNSLMYALTRYEGGGVRLDEVDSEHKTIVHIPRELGLEILGAALGMVNARLLAGGVEVVEITERECFDCGGSGRARKGSIS